MSALEYKCPCCGATLQFDAKINMMLCESCSNTFDMDTLKKYEESVLNGEKTNIDLGNYDSTSGNGDWTADESEHIKSYSCPSCGGEIIGDETLGATTCPYCDSATVIPSQFGGSYKPDYVIPFKKEKADAKAAFKANCKGKILLPKNFLTEQRMEEIKGIYVPFWLYDCNMTADITYRAAKIRAWSDSNYRYTETTTYMVGRNGMLTFEKVPADGSTKMDDTLMEAIEPFNYDEKVPFSTAYLSGFLADKYDVDSEQNKDRINERMDRSLQYMFRDTVKGYSTVTLTSKKIKVNRSSISYALFPVWILNTSYKGKIYTFAMNGQTGKFVGELPVCKSRFWGLFAAYAVGFAALANIFAFVVL